jgi:hypothetical protein
MGAESVAEWRGRGEGEGRGVPANSAQVSPAPKFNLTTMFIEHSTHGFKT